ncbi:hypothetical protein QJQ45_001972 [Haematococcus lacustris]|nr:hypothetical protein QJQ45_001972 [Haematococcus lacustris]
MAAAAGPSGGTQPKRKLGALELQAKLRDSIYSKRFSFQVYEFQGQSVCKAVCGDCDQSYSCVNMSTTNEHKCKPKRPRADTTADAAAAAAAAELPFQRIAKCWNGTALPPCVVEQFWQRLHMFFICAEIPFNKVGNKYLEDALTLVGIPMRSASSLLNGDLDNRYEEVNSLVKLKVDRLDASGDSAMGVTDGWKNKHVELGASLVDFSSLLPDGGRIFHDVKDVSELKKDAEGIKTLLQSLPGGAANPLAHGVLKLFAERRAKSYSPVMAAAYLLDPVNFTLATPSCSPWQLPPFERLIGDQEQDAISTVVRLSKHLLPGQTAAQVQAAVALEVTRLQVCGWKDDKVAMAAALFPPGPPNASGEMVVEAVAARRNFWRKAANNFPLLAAAACKLLAVQVTSAASERNWSAWGRLYTAARNRLGMERAKKLIFIKANADCNGCNGGADAELLALMGDGCNIVEDTVEEGGCNPVASRWDALLPDPRRQKLASPKHRFAQTVDTDGVAISVMFLPPKPAAPRAELPRMAKGMGAVNPLAHLHAECLGVDPGTTNMATVAHEERSADGSVVSVRHWTLTAGQYYRDSGITRQAQATKTWLAQQQPSSLASYRRFADTVLATYDAMWAEVSKPRWANARFRLYCGKKRVVASFWVNMQAKKLWPDRILALAYGGAGFNGSGTIGCRGVPVSQMQKEAVKQFRPGRVVLVDEFRTSRFSSDDNTPSETLHDTPPESFRWPRPVKSMAKRSQVRGLMCSTSINNITGFYDRDVSAALNIRRCAVGPGPRPTELCYWTNRPAMPKPGQPGQDWVENPTSPCCASGSASCSNSQLQLKTIPTKKNKEPLTKGMCVAQAQALAQAHTTEG